MISFEELDDMAIFAEREGPSEQTISAMRKTWPSYHFTWCSDDDIPAAKPVRSHDAFNLYLASGAGGCIGFTSHPENATGVVIAEIEPDN